MSPWNQASVHIAIAIVLAGLLIGLGTAISGRIVITQARNGVDAAFVIDRWRGTVQLCEPGGKRLCEAIYPDSNR